MRSFKGHHITAPVANVLVTGANGNRVGVMIQPPTTGHLHISFGGNADDDTDFVFDAGTSSVILWLEHFGAKIQQKITATLAGAGEAHITEITQS